jgi:membrane associated rhomboid family serine protease
LVNYGIIAANVLVFLFQSSLSPVAFEQFLGVFALTPAHLSLSAPWTWLTLFSSMFMHGGWFHLISNMWTLYIFGDNVEDRMGSGRFLVFYLLAGLAAAFAQVAVMPDSQIPTVGASGAIAGILGAYFLLYPRARVLTVIPVVILPWIVRIPAVLYLGVWFLSQLSSGLLSLGAAGQFGGIAWWAHIGGFVFGLILVRLFTRRRRTKEWYPDEYWPY